MISKTTYAALAATALFANNARALTPVVVQGQDFVLQGTTTRFNIIGVDYQQGGSSGYIPQNGVDPLSNATHCLRDAALMQQLGINTIRSYNLDPDLNHDECASIFNAAGIYMMFDVNSPLSGESINMKAPASSYTLSYLNRTFAVLDAFRNYPNTIGFFGANELIYDTDTSGYDPPYVRAVQRDLRQYMTARGGRQVPIGYSAADVREILPDTAYYVSCDNGDSSSSQFFGLNSYSWCGNSNFQDSGYNIIASDFAASPIPVFFSEFGCIKTSPRLFTEIPVIYGPQMAALSGGLVYQWTNDIAQYGLVNVNTDGSITILPDYVTLQSQYSQLNRQQLMSQNSTATAITAPTCSAAGITNAAFDNNFSLPAQPSGASALIKNGVGGRTGSIVAVTQTSLNIAVTNTAGAVSTGVTISTAPGSGSVATSAASSARTTSTRASGTSAAGTAASSAASASATTHSGASASFSAKSYAGLSLGSLLAWYLGA